jgi:stearoyl-CoA desaturase (delta-9 desaturase)
LYAHLGWLWDDADDTDLTLVRDLAKYPELRWLDRYHLAPPIVLGVAVFWLLGWSGLFIGFFVSTVLLWHSTFAINSVAHVWGRRRYPTKDNSRNSFLLSLLTFGEGWHNNHHHVPGSVRQGFRWWEVDLTYYVLRLMKALGWVWDFREPRVPETARVLATNEDTRVHPAV